MHVTRAVYLYRFDLCVLLCHHLYLHLQLLCAFLTSHTVTPSTVTLLTYSSVTFVLQELLKIMKEGLGGHIKGHAFQYHSAIDRELARIERIKDLKTRAISACFVWRVVDKTKTV